MLRRFPVRLLLAAIVWACACVPVVQAAWWWPFGYDGLKYTVVFEGVDAPTRAWLHTLKLDVRNPTHPPKTAQDLRGEAAAVGARLRQALDARGYYDAALTTDVQVAGTPRIVYRITPGPRYRLGGVAVAWDGPALVYKHPATLPQEGDAVDADVILTGAAALEDAIGDDNCLLFLDVKPRLTLHRQGHTADLTYLVRHGAVANFGPTLVSGTVDVKPAVVRRTVTWQQGQCYRRKAVEDTRAALLQTRLFASVDIHHDREPDAKGEVPMHVAVTERAPRTLSFGASYGTDDTGFAVTAGWEHRNVMGGGEDFVTDATLSQRKKALDNTLTLPAFLPKTRLVLSGNLAREDTDAYTTESLETAASLQRPLAAHLTGGAGVGFNLIHTRDVLAGNSDYALLSFPAFLTYDSRDDVLNSRRGVYANVAETPYVETFGDGGRFFKTEATVKTYLSADWPLSPTLALRASAGSITGDTSRKVPPDIRFHAGGGNSVRGYGYQSLGPRSGTTATGGASLLTASAEVRTWFTPKLGGVVFTDAGNVYEERTPQLGRKLYYGTGVGVRYATPIGPLRFDVAVPMNGRDIGADGYAVYVSIGQSF